MQIKNQTRKTTIASNVIEAKNYIQKTFGLILHNKPTPMLFRTRFGIHTLCMRYPIDIIIIDNTHKVAIIKSAMKPWGFFLWNPKHGLVLELPKDTIKETKTQTGDKLIIS